MSNEILKLKENKNLKEIGQISNEYQLTLPKLESDIEKMALMAKAFNEVKTRLDESMVKSFMSLQNSKLGFKTDKENGYELNTVRECLIECLISGVKPIGNEFNIIGGNFYVTKEGFTGIMARDSSFQDLDIKQELPQYDHDNKRASVKYTATWKHNGKDYSTDGIVSIKLQYTKSNYCVTTDDAIFGKAERKIKSRVWNISSGSNFYEGDAEEITEEQRAANAKNVTPDNEKAASELGL